MGDHKRSKRFKNDEFKISILEKSPDRDYINERETYWIKKLDTFCNGLNESWTGKGSGHNSSNFTTLGYIFSDESRKKMSESAKKRADPEKLRQISLEQWKDPKLRKHHSEIRKGKRLRPLKISDEEVSLIRKHYEQEYELLVEKCKKINKERYEKNSSWKKTNPAIEFGKLYKDKYNCSFKTLENIVLWKTRQKILPYANG